MKVTEMLMVSADRKYGQDLVMRTRKRSFMSMKQRNTDSFTSCGNPYKDVETHKAQFFAYSTEELAILSRLRPNTIRSSLCRLGHWLGLRPIRLSNGRLLWDAAEVARVLRGKGFENSNPSSQAGNPHQKLGGFEHE